MDLLAAENSAVFLMEPDGRSMRAIAARGNAAEALRSEVILLGEGIIGHLAAEGRAEFVNDVFHDPRGIEVPGMNESETERLMVAPLMRGDEVVGMLAVWRTTAPFSQADLNFLIGLARQAAIALENARLFDEIKRQGAYLETIFLNSPVAIVTVDEHDHVMSWNPGAEQLFGYTKDEAIGRNMDELVAGTAETLSQARDYSQQARRHELHVITQRTRKDGSLVDVELSGVPLPLPTGEVGPGGHLSRHHRAAARAAGSRGGQRGQERLPGHHEPRDPHPHERRHRHERPADGHAAEPGAARLRRDHSQLRRRAADDHQRHPGLQQDRGGQDGAGEPALRPARVRRSRPWTWWPGAPTRRAWTWPTSSRTTCRRGCAAT